MNEQLLKLLAGLNVAPTSPVAPATHIQGPIIGLKSGAKIGDCRLRTIPTNVHWVRRIAKDGGAFVQSTTEFAADAHIGPRGGAWADNATDTGVPVADAPNTTAFDLAGALASATPSAAAEPAI